VAEEQHINKTPKILVFAGSIRSGSLNARLADAFTGELVKLDCQLTRLTLADYPLPVYDADFENEKGVPENAVKLARLFSAHQGVVIVGPEYNGSLTPLLKNTIDWISRVRSNSSKDIVPYRGKIAAVAAASNGSMGGISSLGHLRQILVRLGMLVISEQLAVAGAASAFDENDHLTSPQYADMLKAQCKSLVEKATLLG